MFLESLRKMMYIQWSGKKIDPVFSATKVKTYIRMVYDETGSGLYKSIWSPLFGLPTIDLVLIGVGLESYFGDNYLGGLFFNFPLTVSLRTYCGVDLTNSYSLNEPLHWRRRNRCMMGVKPSPYLTTQSMGWAYEFIWGEFCDCDNYFQWLNIRLNFPGDSKYLPSLTWVSNITKEGNLAEEF